MTDPTSTAGPNSPTAPRTGIPGPRMSWGMRVGIRAFFAAISLLVIVASGLAWATFENFTSDIPHGDKVPKSLASDADGADQNILLVGNDTRAGATSAEMKALHTGHDTTTVNADTMMLLHVPHSGSRPTIVSFPRDSWVAVPGHGMGKLNSAYPDGYNAAKAAHRSELGAQSAGIIETIRTIEALTGLSVDHYMQVNLLGFYRISEAIGGVQVCLNAAQNKTTDRDQYHSGYSGIDLPKGTSTIKGAQALAFVRQRHGLPHGDLDRVKRQQYFLKAAFKKVTTAGVLLNPFKLHSLLGAVGKSLLTDPDLDLLSLAQQFQSVASGKITFATIPNNGPKLIYPDGVATSIVQVNKAALPAFLNQLRGKNDDALTKATAAAPGSVTVDVLNGTSVARTAARNADGLKALGFHVDTIDSTSATRGTTVEYPPGHEAQAKAVLAAVPGAKALPSPDVARVTVIVGTNNVMVKGVAAALAPKPSAAATRPTATSAANDAQGLGCID
ncbi:MAG: LCP family protein [Jatrophihabitans sp.]